MGFRYVAHSDMCGCERCAREWERENPSQVWDKVEDLDYLSCGCHASHCDCDDWQDYGDYEEEDAAEHNWTEEDEASLEDYEDNKRRKIAEANEY